MGPNRRPPSYLDKVNTIIDFVEHPCQAPWQVYVELALIPAGKAILQLVEPSLLDIVRAYFRPKGLRKGRHGRHGRRRGRRGGIPDTSELIGHHLPGYNATSMRHVSDGVKFLWLVDGVIQRVFWYWLIADVTLDFFYNWTSAIQKSEYCKYQDQGGAAISGENFGSTGLTRWPIGNRTIDYEYGTCWVDPLAVSVQAPGFVFYPWHHSTPGTMGYVEYAMASCHHLKNGSVSMLCAFSGYRPHYSNPNSQLFYGYDVNNMTTYEGQPIDPNAANPSAGGIATPQFYG